MDAFFPFPAFPRTAYPPVIINAALTGMVPQRDRVPHVPITADEVADDAERCFKAGATIVHLHARDDRGRPDWRRDAYAEMIPEIRRRCPGIVVCATTSGREVADVDRRGDVLGLEGDARPDMASLTLGSLNFHSGVSASSIDAIETLAARMAECGIRPELEIFDLGMAHMAHRLVGRGVIKPPLYANLMLGFPNSSPSDARSLVSLVQALPVEAAAWAAAGFGSFQLTSGALAIAMGGHVRTGLEDNPWLDGAGTIPATNAALVERAVATAASVDRPIATPEEARAVLGLPTHAAAPTG